jgi:hypothetical protein
LRHRSEPPRHCRRPSSSAVGEAPWTLSIGSSSHV